MTAGREIRVMDTAQRIKDIPPYVFVELDKKVQTVSARGIDIINLGRGDPDQPTPAHIVESMRQAVLDPANHHYPPYGGTKEYKQAMAEWMDKRYQVKIDPASETLSLIGGKEGLHHTILAFVDPGDYCIIPDLAYPVYNTSTILAGGTPYFLPLKPENNFLPDLEAIPQAVLDKSKLLMLNYPNNPTAAVADLGFFEKVVHFAKKHNLLFCNDLAYPEMTFDGYKAPSALQVPGAKDVTLELHTLSKTFNMTGWRVGFAVGNSEAIKALGMLKSNVDTDIFRAIQIAATAALKGPLDHIDYCNKLYVERRDVVIKALNQLGWQIKPSKGTFYLWIPVPKSFTSWEFSYFVLEKTGVVVTPGPAYGPGGEGFVRLSLCLPKERLQEAMDRLKQHAITFDLIKAKV